MRYIDVSDDYVAKVLEATGLKAKAKDPIVEAKDAPQEPEVIEEAAKEAPSCPLCESELDEELSDNALQECVEFILNTINELREEEGETLEESDDSEVEEEAEEA